MLSPYLFFIFLYFISSSASTQARHDCDLVKSKKELKKITDTFYFQEIVRYKGTNGHFLNNIEDLFYQKLISKYNIYNVLAVAPLHCDSLYFFPFGHKTKYEYTLYHKKNKAGVYIDWEENKILKITGIRYNRVFQGASLKSFGLITIITDIEPL